MIFDYFGDINWLAVLVATAAYFVLGAIWYSNALMGRQYRAAIGQSDDSPVNVPAIIVNLVAWFVAAIALALISAGIGADTAVDGIVLGLLVGVGFLGTHRVTAVVYEGRGSAIMRVNAPYQLLGLAIMGLILAIWN